MENWQSQAHSPMWRCGAPSPMHSTAWLNKKSKQKKQTKGGPGFTSSLSVYFCLPRSAREKQTHFLPFHSLDGDHPRFECARQLWVSCSLLMILRIFLIRFFPCWLLPPFLLVFRLHRFLFPAISVYLISSSSLGEGIHQAH